MIKKEILEFFENPENDDMVIFKEFNLSRGLTEVGPKIDTFVNDVFEAVKQLGLSAETDVRYTYKDVNGTREFENSELRITLSRTAADVSTDEE